MYVSLLNDSMVYAAQKAELLKRYGALKDFRPLFEAQGKLDLYEKWKTAHKEYEEGHFIIDESSELPILDTKEKQIIEMVYRNDIDALKRAVADGADFNFADDFGNTPLLAAISKKDTAMARFLLENGADPDDWGFIFPIIGAIKTNCAEIVELLIEKGADLSNKDLRFSPIVGSIILQKPEITNLLRKYEFNLDDALFAAMSVRDVTLMEELLDMGADPNMIKFGVPLIDLNEHIGTVGKNISANYRIFRLLLNKKVSLNVYNNTMLSGLAFDDDGTVRSAKEYPTSILTHILLMGIIKKLKLMLENGADPNIPNIGGETPIMFAAFHINCDYNALMGMNYLINYGADPSIKADKGFSAYDLLGKPSVMKGSKCSLPPNMQKTVKLILDKGKKP
jgi:ankyrin repeat protein